MNSDKKDIEKFMKKVENIQSIIEGMTSDDLETQKKSLEEADKTLHKLNENKNIGFDKTVINKKAYDDKTKHYTDQDVFMKALESDAKKRSEERKKRYKEAESLKCKGNSLFKESNYKEALECYNEAINIAKDLGLLYTNRAATYIKLKQFEEAVKDCDFAIMIDENWIKSYYLKGVALRNLHQFTEARSEFEKFLSFDAKKEKMVKGLLQELENEEKAFKCEVQAKDWMEKKNVKAEGICEVIKKLRSKDVEEKGSAENMMYYIGGLNVLSSLCIDEKSRTLFRIQGGFQLITKDIKLIKKCLTENPHSYELSIELIKSFFSLISISCESLPTNLEAYLRCEDVPQILEDLFQQDEHIISSILIDLFYTYSVDESYRSLLGKYLNTVSVVSSLLKVNKIQKYHKAVFIIHNLLLDSSFQIKLNTSNNSKLLDNSASILKFFENFDKNLHMTLLKSFKNLFVSLRLKNLLSFNKDLIQPIREILIKTRADDEEKLINLLSICLSLVNLEKTFDAWLLSQLQKILVNVLCEDVQLMIIRIISKMLQNCSSLASNLEDYTSRQLFKFVLNNNSQLREISLLILCYVAKIFPERLVFMLKEDKGYKQIRQILSIACDSTQNHLVLLFGYLCKQPKLIEPLVHNDQTCQTVVRRLLVLCRDFKLSGQRENCAITIGKIAAISPRFLHHLRDNDGINILSKEHHNI